MQISNKLLEITHMVSFEDEKLELTKTVRIRGATEHWLGNYFKLFSLKFLYLFISSLKFSK
jgi:hypothetical protein